jgi:hypothetical protein
MKTLFFFFILINFNTIQSQTIVNDTLYFFVKKPLISQDENNSYSYFLVKPSGDKRFKSDTYKFAIPSMKDFDEKYQLSEITQIVAKGKIPNKKIVFEMSLYSQDKYLLHEKFSLSKTIYLLFDNPNDVNYYSVLKLLYEGTIKNLIPGENSKM